MFIFEVWCSPFLSLKACHLSRLVLCSLRTRYIYVESTVTHLMFFFGVKSYRIHIGFVTQSIIFEVPNLAHPLLQPQLSTQNINPKTSVVSPMCIVGSIFQLHSSLVSTNSDWCWHFSTKWPQRHRRQVDDQSMLLTEDKIEFYGSKIKENHLGMQMDVRKDHQQGTRR